jgi:hypothetical protein
MSAGGVVLLVVSIVAVVGGAVLVLVLWLYRKSGAVRARLADELATEPAVLGPEPGVYRGSTGAYPHSFGNGHIVLTARRLMFRRLVGAGVDVDLAHITDVTTQKVFNRSVVGTRVHLVVHTPTGDVGYFVKDNDAWIAAIRATAPQLGAS